jgi:NDP-sugar pyrophosphorylase family protein
LKTLLFATGETKKLSPLSNQIVTPMLPVLNRPVMDYCLEMLAKQGVKAINIALLERPADVEGYFGDGRYRGLQLTYHLQREAWGDAGALRRVFDTADEPLLLVPADILIDLPLEAVLEFHNSHSAGITAVVSNSGKYSPNPVFPVDAGDGCEYTGVFLIAPEIVQKIPYRQSFSVMDDLIPLLLSENAPVFNFEYEGYWSPLQSFEQYYLAQTQLCTEEHAVDNDESGLRYLTRQARQVWKGVWIGRNNLIHPSVRIAPIFFSGDNNRLEKEVQVGPDVILGKNIVIAEEATLREAVVLDNTYVGRLMNVQSKIVHKNLVIDIKTGEHVSITDQFMFMEIEERQVDRSFSRTISAVTALILFILFLPLFLLVAVYLGVMGTGVFSIQDCTHTDFRWATSASDRKLRKIKLLRFEVRRKNGVYIPLGKLLEKTRITDLPQLIHIITGDLSLVGVKPLATDTVNQMTEEWQKTRFSVPAGVTGLWYVRTEANTTLDQVLIADAYYAAMHNWKEDLKIVLQTPKAWFDRLQGS